MGIYRTEGIVIRTQDLGEADKIVTVYTRDEGKVRAVARGARRPRNRLLGVAQVFTYSDFLFFRNKGLDTLSQAELKEAFLSLRGDLYKMAYGAYILELVDALTEEGEKNIQLFSLLLATLYLLELSTHYSLLTHAFEIRLMALLGYAPELTCCVSCGNQMGYENVWFSPSYGGILCSDCSRKEDAIRVSVGTVRVLERLLYGDLDKLHILKLTDDMFRELDTILRKYIDYRLEKPLKSLEFLNALE